MIHVKGRTGRELNFDSPKINKQITRKCLSRSLKYMTTYNSIVEVVQYMFTYNICNFMLYCLWYVSFESHWSI